jgi:hypothetical protein
LGGVIVAREPCYAESTLKTRTYAGRLVKGPTVRVPYSI